MASAENNRFDLIEFAPSAAPTARQAPAPSPIPASVSPLAAGQILLTSAATLESLDKAAQDVARLCDRAGLKDKAHPTREALRGMYRAVRMSLAWMHLWASLGRAMQERPGLVQPYPALIPTANSGTLLEALGGLANEGASNASTQSAGSMAGGQLAGVGFTSAQGYVTALANGVKAATAEGYKSTLRGRYGYTTEQIAALVVTLIPEASGLAGAGVVHAPEGGRSVADMSREEARAHFRSLSPAARLKASQEAEIKAAQDRANELQAVAIAGLVAEGEGLIVSPGPAVHGAITPRAEIVAALESIGRADLAPRVKTGKAQFGDVMRNLGAGLHTRAAKKQNAADWSADVTSRWIVSRPDDSARLGSSGDKELIAELVRVGDEFEIRFVGGSTELRERVVAAFTERTGTSALTSTDLLGWLATRVLVGAFHAVKWGGFYWAPGGDTSKAALRTVIDAVHPLLGREIAVGDAANPKAMASGIARSLGNDVAVIVKAYEVALTKAQQTARDKATAEGQDPELASRRVEVSAEVATSRLRDLEKASARIEGFRELIGPERYAPIHAQIEALRSKLGSNLTDGHLRASMLELS